MVHASELQNSEKVHGECSDCGRCWEADISQRWTDTRAKLLRELLSSMQIIKVFTYEIPFLDREYRAR